MVRPALLPPRGSYPQTPEDPRVLLLLVCHQEARNVQWERENKKKLKNTEDVRAEEGASLRLMWRLRERAGLHGDTVRANYCNSLPTVNQRIRQR